MSACYGTCELRRNAAALVLRERPEHPGVKVKFRDAADAAVQGAIASTHSYAPFVSEDVRDVAIDFVNAAKGEVQACSGILAAESLEDGSYDANTALEEAEKGFQETRQKWIALETAIRERMSALSVIDE